MGARADRARLLIRADRAPVVTAQSSGCALLVVGPWPSAAAARDATRRRRRMTQDDWLADRDVPGGGRRPARCARVRRADRLHPAGRRTPSWRPTQPHKAALAGLAVAEFHHYEIARGAARRRWASTPRTAMAPFIAPIDAFHERTRPSRLARGPGQGLRRRRHRHRLLPRDRGLRRPLDPGPRALGAGGRRPGRVRGHGRARGDRRPTRGSPAGSPCGGAGSWARPCRRPSGWRSSATRSPRCSSAAHGPPGRRPGRAGPDVRPAHRRAHPPDGPARPGRLSAAAVRTRRRGPVPSGDGALRACCCGVSRSADLLLAGRRCRR